MAWQQITTRDKVSADTPFAFSIGERSFAIFQVDSTYYALDNVCPHAFALMSDGFVEGDTVECPLHGALFHIPTGRCLGPPADADLKSYPVRLEDEQILVDV
ncbi:non-heme iron oxygenase ferredoxin subunit [Bradyrhizobium sp. CB1717]|uniref:non-heme iron oxygenase ferredoxin subunit n=1 Tax=Bradyrhizobium sp. CB1717 TaxID=3039154 RepID=UPI0024B270F1|nr:non-heme iron oxygenase ferredoxin subunit [Bradyrhizobium sp. CB1717]WFU23209.1 non-heme iron oxygenase ferredoxin subunit [Bradyrhizobium sp. CB1717]